MSDSATLYDIVLLCATIAFAGKSKRVKAAFAGTLVADAFLLFGGAGLYAVGVSVFCFAHIMYVRRNMGVSRFGIFDAACAVAVWLAAWVAFAFPNVIAAVSVVYAVSLITHAVTALFPKRRNALAAVGALLFVGCDVCVALFNAGAVGVDLGGISGAAGGMIWFFYAPSLACLAFSGLKG